MVPNTPKLLDSDTLIEVLRGRRLAADAFDNALATAPVFASTVSVAELYFGAEVSQQVIFNRSEVNSLVTLVQILPVITEIALQFSEVKADLRRRGLIIPDFDLLIASTALVHQCTLVTHNTRHVARITGLQLEDWLV